MQTLDLYQIPGSGQSDPHYGMTLDIDVFLKKTYIESKKMHYKLINLVKQHKTKVFRLKSAF